MGFCEYQLFLTTCTYTNTFFCQSCDPTIRGRACFTTIYAAEVGKVDLGYIIAYTPTATIIIIIPREIQISSNVYNDIPHIYTYRHTSNRLTLGS